ncbi:MULTISPECIES: spore cortex biosynthesis protein YabQ [Aneurinibacillus]|uniref:Spore cortex biosynthesis protein YabQ n=1 Tax=Aneurinibacillus thermoaerophilus TaxID=143495 RepID=A0ABX8YBL5_ANETH|nr:MULTISPECIES: spore cortex biosynthesis protein YabQ [Aneurinibacillus]AMA74512.1 hypothetical protein ACH33_18195 [Aneurinibacillus sp. XH2]MED0675134.1 spore cortex biosynthesis protein YabQ [Aneurinibacillus thermoaerophilus]MED0681256.1 spore cortex biosynthesis protein YabQ [Aneurinibacillus thermoaerophilus]MED0738819.1 spore cortex biosynthesis protein YabQ [Aneurinibacillus thermoaerophilus]MED0757732.1 spore cortex biosynthesis protein YabQ [Aneurinibacillus thermoaerophilus]
MTLTGQAATMMSMVLCGLAMGILYDTYRTMERKCRLARWLVWLCDFLFWISCIFLVFGTLLRVNEGIVRIYIFLGLAVGVVLYFLLFQRTYLYILNKLIFFSLWLYRVTLRTGYYLLVAPVLFLYRILLSTALLLFSVIFRIGKWILLPFRFLGHKLWGWMWHFLQKPLGRVREKARKRWQALTSWIKGKKM